MEALFSKGRSSTSYPIKCVSLEVETALQFPAQAMFVAPKRGFKKAHDRNKLKRRMREVYRLHKAGLYERLSGDQKKLILAFIYIGKQIEDYAVIEKAMLKQLKSLALSNKGSSK